MSEEKTVEAPKQKPKPIPMDDNWNFAPETLEDAFRIANMFCKSGMLPGHYDAPEKVIVGMKYAQELGFHNSMLTAMRQIAVSILLWNPNS